MLTGPFIERELKVALRRHHPARLRFWLAAGCVAFSLLYVFIGRVVFLVSHRGYTIFTAVSLPLLRNVSPVELVIASRRT